VPRPTKWRRVAAVPPIVYFKPAGVPLRELLEVAVGVEEMEAIRLRDVEGLEQEKCATMMSISRPTFHRVLASARRKIAEALTNGKALRIEGGTFALASQTFHCAPHGHEWSLPFEALVSGQSPACPRCNGPAALPAQVPASRPGARRDRRQGERRGRRGQAKAISGQKPLSDRVETI
jgi:predicted DNA-binding protein (UPF0251 family)